MAALVGWLALLCLAPPAWTATDEEILRQVEAEAKRQALTPVTGNEAPNAARVDTSGRLPLGLQQKNFEEVLRDQFAGTFAFYQQLSNEQKNQIFQLYQRDNRVNTIREQTLRFLSGGTP